VVGLQVHTQALPHDTMIVHDQHADRHAGLLILRGENGMKLIGQEKSSPSRIQDSYALAYTESAIVDKPSKKQ
jgi:hypothetical protein